MKIILPAGERSIMSHKLMQDENLQRPKNKKEKTVMLKQNLKRQKVIRRLRNPRTMRNPQIKRLRNKRARVKENDLIHTYFTELFKFKNQKFKLQINIYF